MLITKNNKKYALDKNIYLRGKLLCISYHMYCSKTITAESRTLCRTSWILLGLPTVFFSLCLWNFSKSLRVHAFCIVYASWTFSIISWSLHMYRISYRQTHRMYQLYFSFLMSAMHSILDYIVKKNEFLN